LSQGAAAGVPFLGTGAGVKKSDSNHLWWLAEMSTDQDWIGLVRTEGNFGRIRTGSDYNCFENWRIGRICCFDVIILAAIKILVVM